MSNYNRFPPEFTGKSCPKTYLQIFEKFARAHKWDDEARLLYLPTFLTDGADEWYQSLITEGKWFSTWKTLERGFTAHFVGNERGEYKISDLVRVKQGSTPVREYIQEFRRIATKLPELSEKIVTDLFIEGLHPESRKLLRLQDFRVLNAATSAATRLEAGEDEIQDVGLATLRKDNRQLEARQEKCTDNTVDKLVNELAELKLYKIEMEKKFQQESICNRCFQKGHLPKKCPRKLSTRIMETENRLLDSSHVDEQVTLDLHKCPSDSLELLSIASEMDIDPSKKPKLSIKIPKIVVDESRKRALEQSGNSDENMFLRRLRNQRITFTLYELLKISPYFRDEVMKLLRPPNTNSNTTEVREMHTEVAGAPRHPAKVQGCSVVALIDGGSAINVLRRKLATNLNLTIFKMATPKAIKLGDGSSLQLTDYVADVNLEIGGIIMPFTALLMDAPDYDLLLGRNWLNKVNAVTLWRNGIFRIQWHGREVELNEKLPERVASFAECCSMATYDLQKNSHELTTFGSIKTQTDTKPLLEQIKFGNILTAVEKNATIELIQNYRDVFAVDTFELQQTHLVEHNIILEDGTPVKQRAYRMSPGEESFVKEEIQRMLDKGIIESSNGPWASPIVVVSKKNGSYRLCVDYKKLNSKTRKDSYPLPLIEDLLNTITGYKYYTCLDLYSGYWQVPLADEACEYSAFTCKFGTYTFKVMPFGLTNAPATFQRLMDIVLRKAIGKYAVVYLDDIVVYSNSLEEHRDHLTAIFDTFREAKLKMNPSKCQFFSNEIIFLGHKVTQNGISPEESKMKKIENYPRPATVTELRSFLGLATYYRRFVHAFSSKAAPLTDLLRKQQPFRWEGHHTKAFEELKNAIAECIQCQKPDPKLPYYLFTDASDKGIGAVLTQEINGEKRFIYFFSRKLISAETRYTTTEKECLAIVAALKYLRHYVHGCMITVFTDHQALVHILI